MTQSTNNIIGISLASLDEALFWSAFAYFKTYLDLENTKIPLEVKIVNNIGTGKTDGICTATLDTYSKVKHIEIQIKSHATVFGMIEALAHEMVHAKQFICGDATFEKGYHYLFGLIPLPKRIKLWKGFDVSSLEYFQQPCEQQAFILQKELTLTFLKTIERNLESSKLLNFINSDTKTFTTDTIAEKAVKHINRFD